MAVEGIYSESINCLLKTFDHKTQSCRRQSGGTPCRSGVQVFGVMLDVVAYEGVDEEVAVIVALQEEEPLASAAGNQQALGSTYEGFITEKNPL